jgi:tetratricopeptide (TPR) repeat protein
MFGISKIKDEIVKKIKSFEGWVSDGDNYLDIGDYENAAECYYNALSKNSNDDKVWYSMAYALYKLGDYSASLDAIDEALKINPKNPKYHYLKGSIYYELGKYVDESYNLEGSKKYLEEAFKHINICYEQNKQNTSALIKMGKILIYFGEFEKAYNVFKRCYKLNPNCECKEFVKLYNIVVKNMDSFEYIESGLSLLNSKKYIDAIKYFNKASELNENDELSLYYKSCIYEYFRDYKKALSYIDNSLKITERDIFLSKKGDILFKLRKFDDAVNNYEKALDINNNLPYAYLGLGILYYTIEKHEYALECFDRLFELYMEHLTDDEKYMITIYTLIGKGEITNNTDFFEEALNYIDRQINMDMDNIDLWILKGYVLFKMEKYREALGVYNNALSIDPNNIEILESLAIIYENLGKFDDAIRVYEKLLKLNPDDEKYINAKYDAEKSMFENKTTHKCLTSPLLKEITMYHKIKNIEVYIMEIVVKYIRENNPLVSYHLLMHLNEYISSREFPEIDALKDKLMIEIYKYIENKGNIDDSTLNLAEQLLLSIKENQ